jgi:regulatory protein
MDYNQALAKAMQRCSKAEKCSSDLLEKLKEWGVSTHDQKKIISYLIDERFIDDERFATLYVREKFRFNQWGRIKIGFMLKGKQLPEAIIAKALNSIDPTTYHETLTNLLQQKARSLKNIDPYELKAKLIRFAQSRGFEFEEIEKVLKQV